MNRMFATGTTGAIGRYLPSNVQLIPIDLKQDLGPSNYFSLPPASTVLHLAGIVGTQRVQNDPVFSHKVNVEGSIQLAYLAQESNVDRFIYVSTSHVYAPTNRIITEYSPVSPSSLYAVQKYEAELAITQIFRDSPSKLCIVRVFSALDWGMPSYTLGGAIEKLSNTKSNYQLKNASDIRDFLTPKLIAQTLLKIAHEKSLTNVVNLSSMVATSIRDAAYKMLNSNGLEFPAERVFDGNSEVPFIVGDNSKLISIIPNLKLRWQPTKLTIIQGSNR